MDEPTVNNVGDEGAVAIGEALKNNSTLICLNLDGYENKTNRPTDIKLLVSRQSNW